MAKLEEKTMEAYGKICAAMSTLPQRTWCLHSIADILQVKTTREAQDRVSFLKKRGFIKEVGIKVRCDLCDRLHTHYYLTPLGEKTEIKPKTRRVRRKYRRKASVSPIVNAALGAFATPLIRELVGAMVSAEGEPDRFLIVRDKEVIEVKEVKKWVLKT